MKGKNYMPPDPDRADAPEHWLDNAIADLAIARIPLPPDALYEHLCFHAQQAVGKSLKAVLIALGLDFPPTHKIQSLIDRIPAEIPKHPVLSDAANLTPYAVSTRYPGESEPVTEEEYREALHTAEAIVSWAGSLIAK
jgi:HEPN domain-containing protein